MIKNIRVCQKCGKPFKGSRDSHYCQECAKKVRKENVMQERTCIDCGRTFIGGPRAKRCAECAHIAQMEISKNFKKNGAKRPLGSIDKCQVCGKEYVVKSGRQKYCSEKCMHEAVLAWQRKHKKGYGKKPEIKAEKQGKREKQMKICKYCLREFKEETPTQYCSDYCRTEQKKIQMCIGDMNRGLKRNLERYEKKRQQYREQVRENKI